MRRFRSRYLTNLVDSGDTVLMAQDDTSGTTKGDRPSYPPGHQPYEKLVGMRVGAIVGGLVGGVGAFILGGAFAWLIVIGAIIGGVIGHRMGEA